MYYIRSLSIVAGIGHASILLTIVSTLWIPQWQCLEEDTFQSTEDFHEQLDFKPLLILAESEASLLADAQTANAASLTATSMSCPPPSITAAGPFCIDDGVTTLSASPPGGDWSGTGIVNSVTGQFDPSLAGYGNHQIIYTYVDTCISYDTLVVAVGGPDITFISGDGLNCHGDANGNVILGVSGGIPFAGPYPYTFDWDWDQTPGNDDYSCGCASQEFEDLSGLEAGVYVVTVTDAVGCTTTAFAEVTQPSSTIIISGTTDISLDCFGQINGVIDISVTGGTPSPFTNDYIYDWDWSGTGFNDDIGGPADPTDDDQDPANIMVGTYSVTVTDFLGCTSTAVINVTEPEELMANATTNNVPCSGESSAFVDLTVSGGTSPFDFDWDNDGTGDNDDTEDLTDVPAGIYNVTVTDANGCTATATIQVEEPSAPVDASETHTDVNCFGDADASIDLTPSGGTGAFTFDWSNDGVGDNDDPEDLTGLQAGSYSVTVTDANGCTVVVSVNIEEPPELTSNLDTTICTGGSIVVNGTTYNETNTSGTETFITSEGCDSIVTINVSIDPPPTSEITYSGCEGDGYSIVVNGTTYNEANPSGQETVTTADGCDSIVTVSLTFTSGTTGEETYSGCTGDGYSVMVGNTVYDEQNPTGTETLTSADGCDSVVTVNLTFNQHTTYDISNNGCEGDGFSVVVNGTTYDENNPSGMEVILNEAGCDSVITINLQFGSNSTSDVSYSGCTGDGYSVVVNGTTYNEANPSGTETMVNADGCDSVITINLQFSDLPTGEENYNGCTGDGYSVTVNGTPYNESNPSGTEVIAGGDCDSVVTINLQFNQPSTGDETYNGCTGDGYSVDVGGTLYNESNPSGTETLTNAAGCDSVVTINLQFGQPSTGEELYNGCTGDGYWVEVNGTVYNETNPFGTEVLENAAGCDSVVTIDLNYNSTSTGDEFYTGCSGDPYSIVVNGTLYDESNPTGTETMPGANGCDSTVFIDLVFAPVGMHTINHNGCTGDGYSVIVNGTLYDENNTNGTEIVVGPNGCDSIITVDLSFASEIIVNLDTALCSGGSILVGSTTYDENNTTGTEVLTAQGGCDSSVNVSLSFLPVPTGQEVYNGCTGDGYFVVVNGNIYDEVNPSGQETLTSPQGCDSIVLIDLNFNNEIQTDLDSTLCSGESIVVNGNVYDETNPTGTEVFSGSGCDSIVTVVLTFIDTVQSNISYTGCVGDGYSVVVNGTVYDESNPTGQEIMPSQAGCDSMINVNLQFGAGYAETISYQGCSGDGYQINVNGTVYSESNPSGTESMQDIFGCDSVITIDLVFGDTVFQDVTYAGCTGDGYSVVVNGTTYDENNPQGEEIIATPGACDTVITINLTYSEAITTTLETTLCDGDSMVVNGVTYDSSNPTGTEVFSGSSCDSIVNVSLNFYPAYNGIESYTGCMGDGYSITINGNTYDESNTQGTEVLQSTTGCDSVVTIDLSFANCCVAQEVTFDISLCSGNSYSLNGVEYTISGTYADTIPDAVGQGCDSIYVLNLEVEDAVTEYLEAEICQGEQYTFAGAMLMAAGMYSDTIAGGAAGGCDSIVVLELQVTDYPSAEAGSNQMITCAETDVMLTGSGSDGNVIWTGPGIDSTLKDEWNVTVDKPGWYWLEVVNPTGCSTKDSVLVELSDDVPVVVAEADHMLSCQDDMVQLHAEVIGANTEITWVGPGITPEVSHNTDVMVYQAGVYVLHAINSVSECVASPDTVLVEDLREEVMAAISEPEPIDCDVSEVFLDGSGSTAGTDIIYTWQNHEHSVVGHDNTLQVGESGMYYLMVMDTMSKCSGMDSVMIEDHRILLDLDAGEDRMLDCKTHFVILNEETSGPEPHLVYTWTGPNSGIISDPNAPSIEVVMPGSYTLHVLDTLSSCDASDEVFVGDLSYEPFAEAGADLELHCGSSEVTLDASQSDSGSSIRHIWEGPGISGDTTSQVKTTVPGTYWLTVYDEETGCWARDSVRVLGSTALGGAIIEYGSPLCKGDTDGFIEIGDVIGGTPPFSYALNNGTFQSSPIFSNLGEGVYTIYVRDDKGCQWETLIHFEEGIEVHIDVGPDITIQAGDTWQLLSDVNTYGAPLDSIIWAPGNMLSCRTCPNPDLIGIDGVTLVATVYSSGCTATDSLRVEVERSINIYIPNIFSPNHDGVNDWFTLYADENISRIVDLAIFDRWGEKIFANEDFPPNSPQLGWDGRYNDQELLPGVFVYVISVERYDGGITTLKGDVTLVR